MSSKAMSLNARIRNYAKENNIPAQVVLQNYMFERFLARLSLSEFKGKFVIKGGILIASIVGLDTRSTMDLDATLKDLPLTKNEILNAINKIIYIDITDNIHFQVISIGDIRNDDPYGGYCVRLNAIYETIVTPLSIDISTGDILTPSAVPYRFRGIFDKNLCIHLWGYNIETVLAEKLESILRLNIFNTRARDFYDVYILGTTQKVNKLLLKDALLATSKHRGSAKIIREKDIIIAQIERNEQLEDAWKKYQNRFSYAKHIEYRQIMETLKILLSQVSPEE